MVVLFVIRFLCFRCRYVLFRSSERVYMFPVAAFEMLSTDLGLGAVFSMSRLRDSRRYMCAHVVILFAAVCVALLRLRVATVALVTYPYWVCVRVWYVLNGPF